MRALHALRVSLPGSSAGTGWRRLLSIAALTALAVVGPAAAAYATDSVVSERPVISDSSDHGLLVRAHASAERLYPGARQDMSLLVTNLGADRVTTGSVRQHRPRRHRLGRSVRSQRLHDAAHHSDRHRDPGRSHPQVDLPDALTMKRSAGNGCQGAVLRLAMSVDAS